MAAWVFAVSAARLLQLLVQPRSGGDGFAALIYGGLAGIGAWIAVGPGARVCAAGLSGQRMESAEGFGCRLPFGAGAVVTSVLALYCGWRWLRARRAASPDAA
jgi:hypothetical protein